MVYYHTVPTLTYSNSESAKGAGFTDIVLIDESVAAVYAHEIGQDQTSAHTCHVVVYDVGASITRVSVVAVRRGMYIPIAYATDTTLTGNNIDDALADYLAQDFKKYDVVFSP